MTEKDRAPDGEQSSSPAPTQKRRRPRQATLIGMAAPSAEPGGAPRIATDVPVPRPPARSLPQKPAAAPKAASPVAPPSAALPQRPASGTSRKVSSGGFPKPRRPVSGAVSAIQDALSASKPAAPSPPAAAAAPPSAAASPSEGSLPPAQRWASAPPPGGAPEGRSLEGQPTHVGEPPPAPHGASEELQGESTSVTAALPYEATQTDARALEDEAGTEPQLAAPDELPAEATQPAASLPPAPERRAAPEISAHAAPPAPPPGASTAPPDDFVSVPTVVVDPDAAVAEPAPTYAMDTRSGQVSLAHEETAQVALPDTPPKSRAGLFVGLGALALIVLAGGGVAAWLLLSPSEAPPPVAHAGEPEAPDEVPADPAGDETPTPTGAVAPADGEPSGADGASAGDEAGDEADIGADTAAEGESELADDAPDEATDEAAAEEGAEESAPAPAGDLTREAMLAFELESLRPSRRASRMSQARRRAQSDRLKSRALRAYRGEEYAEAERLYREALTFNSWDVAAVEGMARAIAQQGRFPEARAWAQLAVDRNPRSAATYRILGDVWRQAGFEEEARDAYRRGLRRVPDDRWLRQRIRDLR